MGDDAELYWEMEHNPYFWDEVESCSRNNSFTENKSKKKKKTIQTKSNSTRKKVNAALFIDGENISSKKAEQIQKIANKQGVLGIEKVLEYVKEYTEKVFEDIKHIDESGKEYWEARELQKALEYKEWRNFKLVIDKAIISCNNSNFNVFDHFVEVNKMIELGKTAKRKQDDYKLSRYACYLIVQNADSKK